MKYHWEKYWSRWTNSLTCWKPFHIHIDSTNTGEVGHTSRTEDGGNSGCCHSLQGGFQIPSLSPTKGGEECGALNGKHQQVASEVHNYWMDRTTQHQHVILSTATPRSAINSPSVYLHSTAATAWHHLLISSSKGASSPPLLHECSVLGDGTFPVVSTAAAAGWEWCFHHCEHLLPEFLCYCFVLTPGQNWGKY